MWKIKMRICQKTHFQISNYSDCMLGITRFDVSQNDFTVLTLPTASSLLGFPFNIPLNNPQCCPGSWSEFAGKESFFPCLVPDPAFVSHPLLILWGFMNSPSPSTHWPLFSLWLAYGFFHCPTSGCYLKEPNANTPPYYAFKLGPVRSMKLKIRRSSYRLPSLSESSWLENRWLDGSQLLFCPCFSPAEGANEHWPVHKGVSYSKEKQTVWLPWRLESWGMTLLPTIGSHLQKMSCFNIEFSLQDLNSEPECIRNYAQKPWAICQSNTDHLARLAGAACKVLLLFTFLKCVFFSEYPPP